MHGGRSYIPLDDILPPPDEDMIDNIGEESDDDGATLRPHPRNFPMTKTGFQQFARKLQKRIIIHQRYLEVIRNRAIGMLADDEQSGVADGDVAWLREHNHIVNPSAAGSSANRNHTSSPPAAN